MAKQSKRELINLKLAFPEITTDWIQLLCERCESHKVTEEDFKNGINKLIDTYTFNKPTIASAIQLMIKPIDPNSGFFKNIANPEILKGRK